MPEAAPEQGLTREKSPTLGLSSPDFRRLKVSHGVDVVIYDSNSIVFRLRAAQSAATVLHAASNGGMPLTRMRYRPGKIKLQHSLIEGLRERLEAIASLGEVSAINPGEIRPRGGTVPFELTFQYFTESGFKLLAKNTTSLQEVFVVTADREAVLEKLSALGLVDRRATPDQAGKTTPVGKTRPPKKGKPRPTGKKEESATFAREEGGGKKPRGRPMTPDEVLKYLFPKEFSRKKR